MLLGLRVSASLREIMLLKPSLTKPVTKKTYNLEKQSHATNAAQKQAIVQAAPFTGPVLINFS